MNTRQTRSIENVFTNDCYIVQSNIHNFESFLGVLGYDNPEWNIWVIRGYKAQTLQDFHNEIAAALQFPSSYGENWSALEECLNDLKWLPGAGPMLGFPKADLLFSKMTITKTLQEYFVRS